MKDLFLKQVMLQIEKLDRVRTKIVAQITLEIIADINAFVVDLSYISRNAIASNNDK